MEKGASQQITAAAVQIGTAQAATQCGAVLRVGTALQAEMRLGIRRPQRSPQVVLCLGMVL